MLWTWRRAHTHWTVIPNGGSGIEDKDETGWPDHFGRLAIVHRHVQPVQ